jgi:hypothetical protein
MERKITVAVDVRRSRKVWESLHRFFFKTLACRPDREPVWLFSWWYGFTGRLASFCHRQYCERCAEKYAHRRGAA